jgi:ankyrin repeat protein
MCIRFVEETDPTRQAPLEIYVAEIYVAVVLKTLYNYFDTHYRRTIMMSRKTRWAFVLGAGAMLSLLSSCKNEAAKEPTAYSTIHAAAINGDLADVKRHLAQGADVNAKATGGTPLHYAASRGHKDIVEYLVSKGADVNAGNENGRRPLHYAAENGHGDVIEYLVSNGADVNGKDNNGHTPLYFAAIMKHEDTVDLLKKLGAKE